jgi:hypothetical protein
MSYIAKTIVLYREWQGYIAHASKAVACQEIKKKKKKKI